MRVLANQIAYFFHVNDNLLLSGRDVTHARKMRSVFSILSGPRCQRGRVGRDIVVIVA